MTPKFFPKKNWNRSTKGILFLILFILAHLSYAISYRYFSQETDYRTGFQATNDILFYFFVILLLMALFQFKIVFRAIPDRKIIRNLHLADSDSPPLSKYSTRIGFINFFKIFISCALYMAGFSAMLTVFYGLADDGLEAEHLVLKSLFASVAIAIAVYGSIHNAKALATYLEIYPGGLVLRKELNTFYMRWSGIKKVEIIFKAPQTRDSQKKFNWKLSEIGFYPVSEWAYIPLNLLVMGSQKEEIKEKIVSVCVANHIEYSTKNYIEDQRGSGDDVDHDGSFNRWHWSSYD